MLARHGDTGIWREIRRNPLIWATLAGLLLNLAGFVPPQPLSIFLGRLADATVALGLLAVGAALRLRGQAGVLGASIYLSAVKLVALPIVAPRCSADFRPERYLLRGGGVVRFIADGVVGLHSRDADGR